MIKKTVAFMLFIVLWTACCAACAEPFTLRGGIQFGMSPDEVIEIEASNGFHYDLTSKGDILYKGKNNYQLYFEDKNIGFLGTLPIYRFEYDFDLDEKLMYQFYYVLKGKDAYEYLVPSLTQKYGTPDAASNFSTELYRELGDENHLAHSRWLVTADEDAVVIDIWENKYDVCFLVYQALDGMHMLDEQTSLDFGL